jgi:hypothetical protein
MFMETRLARLTVLVAVFALTGCATGRLRGDRDGRANVYPANFKTDLLGAVHAYVGDPSNIHDAYLAEPAIRTVSVSGKQKRYAACLRFNAKDMSGHYTGNREVLAVFAAGRFDQFVDPTTQPNQPDVAMLVQEQCKDADYQRFPELEALK